MLGVYLQWTGIPREGNILPQGEEYSPESGLSPVVADVDLLTVPT